MASSYSAQSLFEVKDIVAVITGGGSGLGKVMAHALAANGAKAVYILGRREEALDQTKASSPNPGITYICLRVRRHVQGLASGGGEPSAQRHGLLQRRLCQQRHCHGRRRQRDPTQVGSSSVKSLQEQLWAPNMDDLTKTFHVNITGAFYTAVAFLDLLDEANKRAVVSQKSQVVITASMAAFSRAPAAGFAYGPSKAAVVHLTKQLSTVLAPLKIRVNAIAPGIYPTDMTESTILKHSANPRQESGLPKELVPLERCGTEEEMAGVALFLASKAGGYV